MSRYSSDADELLTAEVAVVNPYHQQQHANDDDRDCSDSLHDIPVSPPEHPSFSASMNIESEDPSFVYSLLQDEKTTVDWDKVRKWLWSATVDARRAAMYIRGTHDVTVLHLLAKQPQVPDAIWTSLLQAAPEVASWTDAHGWLPLHHAAANTAGNSLALQLLVEAHGAGVTCPDTQGRTPLHFLATREATLQDVEYLQEAASIPDAGGMLPLHYAAAYGSTILKSLAEAFPEALTAMEQHGRTCMHLAMVNAYRENSPIVLQYLLQEAKETINARDSDGNLPLHLMAMNLKVYRKQNRYYSADRYVHVNRCLQMYLDAEPYPAADFLTVLQDLPDVVRPTAVVTKHVRTILNQKICQRFPTSILMMDALALVMLIVGFAICTHNHIDIRMSPDPVANTSAHWVVACIVGASYFLTRELVQIISLARLGSLSSWFTDPANWLDLTVIVLVFYYSIAMVTGDGDHEAFRIGVTITQGTLWVAMIVQLKSTLVDFAVFVGGLFNVVQRLVAFLYAVGVILLAFAQMFYYVYTETEMCQEPTLGVSTIPPQSENFTYFDPDLINCSFPHCSFDESLLKVYTMMMGEIGDETRYATNLTAQILYVGYAFLVVILLSNVLIAIVTDSYEFIQNDRAAVVFWSNRLDFVAEMDAISYSVGRRDKDNHAAITNGDQREPVATESPVSMMDELGVPQPSRQASTRHVGSPEYFREGWHQIMMLFDSDLYDDVDWIETWVYNIFRVFCIFVVIPLWLVIGFISAGWLWPPQVREYLFVQRETVASRSELERQKLEKLKAIESDLMGFKQDMMREMATDRDDMLEMKAEVDAIQSEVLADLMQVKELLNSFLMT